MDPMDAIARALAQVALIQERQVATVSVPRVRAINCRMYHLDQDWRHYSSYFRENVRAAYGYAHGDAALNDACCTWIAAKLTAGPTLTAYENLSDEIKSDWEQLDAELSRLYVNEEEKQSFLSNIAWFKRGNQSLMIYKNELISRLDLYQPDLRQVDIEYQRQLVDRFISGLDDDCLRRKLRFHCRRERMTINHAYEYAIDYESTEAESRVKEIVVTQEQEKRNEENSDEEDPVLSAAGYYSPATAPYQFVPRRQGGGYLYDPNNATYGYYSPYFQ